MFEIFSVYTQDFRVITEYIIEVPDKFAMISGNHYKPPLEQIEIQRRQLYRADDRPLK